MDLAKTPTSKDWEAIITDWLASGLSQTKFCAKRGLKSHQLSYYYRKYHPTDSAPTKLANISVNPKATNNPSSNGFVLAFPTGIKLSIPSTFCEQSLAGLLQIIKESTC